MNEETKQGASSADTRFDQTTQNRLLAAVSNIAGAKQVRGQVCATHFKVHSTPRPGMSAKELNANMTRHLKVIGFNVKTKAQGGEVLITFS